MNREEVTAQLEALLPWSKEREIPTKRGPRLLRKARPTEDFWNAWRAGRDNLKALGISVAKNDYAGGDWEVCWWREIDQQVQQARAVTIEQSRAVDAEIDIPCNDGMAYMPFQRAGVAFCLKRFGIIT